MKASKIALIAAAVALIAAFFALDLGQYFQLDYLTSQQAALDFFKAKQAAIDLYYRDNPLPLALAFFTLYVVVTAASLPVAGIMTLAAGAIFGLAWGTLIVSFASSLGATLAFLASRFLFRELIQRRFGDRLGAIDAGVKKEGAFYLFTLRLVPVFPFFVINLLMGLTSMKAWTFYWVSQLGMLAGTVVYVNAGIQIAQISSPGGILSAKLIGSFVLLGIFPLIAKKIVDMVKARKVYSCWQRPARFDRNLIVIGAGSAGLVTAYIAAAVKARVTLIEKHKMGGDCLNTGCVPSKALIRSAKFISQVKRAHELGIRSASASFDFGEVMERVQRVVRTVEPHDSVGRYTALGVECIAGEAKITTPWSVEVKTASGAQTLTARAIVIAAGARPFVPPIPGIEQVGCYTSDDVWNLRALPRRLVVLGGGPIGSELTQCFARLGSQVTQVEMLQRILMREDPEISDRVMQRFRAEGVNVLVNHNAKQFILDAGEKVLICEHDGEEVRVPFDELLCAVGRVANTSGYGLEELGIPLAQTRTVETNEYLQTLYPNIYACGDVAGPYQFTHTAAHQAWYASVNALFGDFKKFKADYSVIPWATFTDPEVARVGLNETEAREKGIAYEVSVFDLAELDRAIADEEAHGLIKVLTVPGADKILGCTIVGEHAGDLIAEYVAAMRHGFGLNKILGTIHIYPTLAEANKHAAGVWKRNHAPQRLLAWAEKFHAWRRG
ncbi:MAG TPA: FAD-dependent oxidoreductase [Burkholderiales bacterium]